jgi:hypothetical protein
VAAAAEPLVDADELEAPTVVAVPPDATVVGDVDFELLPQPTASNPTTVTVNTARLYNVMT